MARSTSASTRLVVGNWKMNGGSIEPRDIGRLAACAETLSGVRVGLCPPATLLHRLSVQLASAAIVTGGQDCHAEASGAFTGDLAAQMLAEAGARLVILGHSERRTMHGETDDLVARKVRAAIAAGLEPIVCVGETLAQRQAGQADDVVRRQLRGSLPSEVAGADYAVAYEPVWAIGTGQGASAADVARMHRVIREELRLMFRDGDRAPILYGGSVTGETARAILATPDVGGLLVGGASLKVASFLAVLQASAPAA